MSSFRLAHLSDLHFSKLSFGITQFFSKQWIGNFNFLLRRKREFDYANLDQLLPLFIKEKIEMVIISGDVSCTSLDAEFLQASAFVQKLEKNGIQTIVIPGNHDHYTKKSYKEKSFYRFFPSLDLQENRVSIKNLTETWQLITLDTTLATPLFCCHGKFDEALENRLEEVLSNTLPNTNLIIVNHFPIGHPSDSSLQGEKRLLTLIQKYPQVRLYLHGHTHKRRIHPSHPIIIDAGSAAHRFFGSWNQIECKEKGCSILPFTWKKTHWAPEKEAHFTW